MQGQDWMRRTVEISGEELERLREWLRQDRDPPEDGANSQPQSHRRGHHAQAQASLLAWAVIVEHRDTEGANA